MTRHAGLVLLLLVGSLAAGDWPQWRGPDRSNISKETGLLKEWPKDGPPLAWKFVGLGDGVAPVAVANGRVITTGYRDKEEFCTALSEKDGKQLWSVKVGPALNELGVMRWLCQRTPTVDGERIYVVTAGGEYVCLAADSGKELWRKHFQKDFDGKRSGWAYCDYPLVDGDRLLIAPGGEKSAVVALDKKTGDTIWKCPLEGGDTASHSVVVAADIGGVRQYIHHFNRNLVGVEAATGKLLWRFNAYPGPTTATTHGPLVDKDTIFFASGYGAGHYLIRVTRKDGEFQTEEIYRSKNNVYAPWLGGLTQVGGSIFANGANGMVGIDREKGTQLWSERVGRVCYTIADGRCYFRNSKGLVTLAEIDAKGLRTVSEFTPSSTKAPEGFWTFPVIANGKLYLREFDLLLVYDIREPDRRQRNAPDAGVFVPSPPDVVSKMLDLADVKKTDLVYDLGSGDGRIVIAAARLGCAAVGVELDKELVRLSREKIKEAGVEKLATIVQGDLFEADFSKADIVATYLVPTALAKLVPKFNKLKPGSRIVAHAFAIPGIKPAKAIEMTSDDDDAKRKIFLYALPLVEEK